MYDESIRNFPCAVEVVMGKRCHRFVFPFLLVMILSAGCSQSTPSAPPTTEPTFTEEAIPMADDVDSVQDALPADDSGAPAVYSSVTLEGALTVASHRHEEGDNL